MNRVKDDEYKFDGNLDDAFFRLAKICKAISRDGITKKNDHRQFIAFVMGEMFGAMTDKCNGLKSSPCGRVLGLHALDSIVHKAEQIEIIVQCKDLNKAVFEAPVKGNEHEN